VSDEKPGNFGCGRSFEVFGKAAASAEPGEGAFNHPTSRQKLEAFDARRSLDDLDRPRSGVGERIEKLLAAINAVSKNMLELWEATA
jgi:hypothetical protein